MEQGFDGSTSKDCGRFPFAIFQGAARSAHIATNVFPQFGIGDKRKVGSHGWGILIGAVAQHIADCSDGIVAGYIVAARLATMQPAFKLET